MSYVLDFMARHGRQSWTRGRQAQLSSTVSTQLIYDTRHHSICQQCVNALQASKTSTHEDLLFMRAWDGERLQALTCMVSILHGHGYTRMIGALTPRRLGKRGWSVLSSCIIPSNCISVYPFKMHVNYFV